MNFKGLMTASGSGHQRVAEVILEFRSWWGCRVGHLSRCLQHTFC